MHVFTQTHLVPFGAAPPPQVTFNPQDNTQLCVVGQGVFKLFRYSEGNLKQFALQKADSHAYLSQAWVSDDGVIAGTDAGQLLLFEAGELRKEFDLLRLAQSDSDRNAAYAIRILASHRRHVARPN